jgi:hypothetical protein
MKFLTPQLGFTKFGHERNIDIRGKFQIQNIAEENKKEQRERMHINKQVSAVSIVL